MIILDVGSKSVGAIAKRLKVNLPPEEDSVCRAVLRELVLLSPTKISAGKGAPDIVILFEWEDVQAITDDINRDRPPTHSTKYMWIGPVYLRIKSSSNFLEPPNLNKEFYPFQPNDKFYELKPDKYNYFKMEIYRKNWLLKQLKTEFIMPFAAWINSLSI